MKNKVNPDFMKKEKNPNEDYKKNLYEKNIKKLGGKKIFSRASDKK